MTINIQDQFRDAIRASGITPPDRVVADGAIPGEHAHRYLAKKGVRAHGVRVQPGDTLLVPRCDETGTLHSIQRISYDAEGNFSKRFQKDGRTKGCFHMLGDPGERIYIAE